MRTQEPLQDWWQQQLRCGLVVWISGSHPGGPGSILDVRTKNKIGGSRVEADDTKFLVGRYFRLSLHNGIFLD